jgi:hypothetical protein
LSRIAQQGRQPLFNCRHILLGMGTEDRDGPADRKKQEKAGIFHGRVKFSIPAKDRAFDP